jgi:hypothetical protein
MHQKLFGRRRERLAHMGLSISTTAINEMVNSLLKESRTEIQMLGQTLLTSYAYENLDIDLKHAVPTIEKDPTTLIHLTSATMLPLDNTVMLEDLNCLELLWKQSCLNIKVRRGDLASLPEINNLLDIHPEAEHSLGLLRRNRFNAWMFLRDLVEHGTSYFHAFSKLLKVPEVIEQLPIKKIQFSLYNLIVQVRLTIMASEGGNSGYGYVTKIYHQTDESSSIADPRINLPASRFGFRMWFVIIVFSHLSQL